MGLDAITFSPPNWGKRPFICNRLMETSECKTATRPRALGTLSSALNTIHSGRRPD